ncbi:UPF0271 protein [Arthrobacter sp. yr096]|uniref:LamB/YcsF family protein n=1 Tax=Arthrobacter sp. yr096 TaxID=1761750 RepID=UPI0008D0CB59|nr:5-oxoprolinase subunit PxpA [Arthrobacter sp. yr096]SEJ77881.1 UPF0271 protein [Arthrobacter sp. yr096]
MTTKMVDLIADVGEGFGSYTAADDEAMIELISSANIACGFHAGDPTIMKKTVDLCLKYGVSIGAHPGFPDLRGFGRYAMDLPPEQISADVTYQIGALDGFCRSRNVPLNHVTPHGRLANLMVTHSQYAGAVASAIYSLEPTLIVVGQEGELTRSATALGMKVAHLAVVDRGYADDGQLIRRSEPGALIHDPNEIADRAVQMVLEGNVHSASGKLIPVKADSVLLHGDKPGSVAAARAVRKALEAADIQIASLPEVVSTKVAT